MHTILIYFIELIDENSSYWVFLDKKLHDLTLISLFIFSIYIKEKEYDHIPYISHIDDVIYAISLNFVWITYPIIISIF